LRVGERWTLPGSGFLERASRFEIFRESFSEDFAEFDRRTAEELVRNRNSLARITKPTVMIWFGRNGSRGDREMAKEKFDRNKPHCNVGTIGHIDHARPR